VKDSCQFFPAAVFHFWQRIFSGKLCHVEWRLDGFNVREAVGNLAIECVYVKEAGENELVP